MNVLVYLVIGEGAILGYCAVSATVAEIAQVQAHTIPYFLFDTAATDRSGINGRLLADHTK